MKIIVKYIVLGLISIIIGLILIAFSFNYILSLENPLGIKVIGDPSLWLLFFASVPGGIMSGAVAGIVAYYISKKQIEAESKTRYKLLMKEYQVKFNKENRDFLIKELMHINSILIEATNKFLLLKDHLDSGTVYDDEIEKINVWIDEYERSLRQFYQFRFTNHSILNNKNKYYRAFIISATAVISGCIVLIQEFSIGIVGLYENKKETKIRLNKMKANSLEIYRTIKETIELCNSFIIYLSKENEFDLMNFDLKLHEDNIL